MSTATVDFVAELFWSMALRETICTATSGSSATRTRLLSISAQHGMVLIISFGPCLQPSHNVGFTDRCTSCSYHLHTGLQCKSFDAGHHEQMTVSSVWFGNWCDLCLTKVREQLIVGGVDTSTTQAATMGSEALCHVSFRHSKQCSALMASDPS